MKRIIMVAVAVMMASFFASERAVHADPTLEETIQYLDKKLGEGCRYTIPGELKTLRISDEFWEIDYQDGAVTYGVSVELISPRRIVVKEETFQTERYKKRRPECDDCDWEYKSDALQIIETLEVSLDDLFANVTIRKNDYYGYYIYSQCFDGKCAISQRKFRGQSEGEWRGWNNMGKEHVKGFGIYICDPKGEGERIRKAFLHAIKISGGKEELF